MRTPAQPVALTSPGPDRATQRDPVQRRRLPSGKTPRCNAGWKVPPRRPSSVIRKALATWLDRRPSSRLRVVPCGSAIAITAIAREDVSFRRTARSLDRPTPPEGTLTSGVPAPTSTTTHYCQRQPARPYRWLRSHSRCMTYAASLYWPTFFTQTRLLQRLAVVHLFSACGPMVELTACSREGARIRVTVPRGRGHP